MITSKNRVIPEVMTLFREADRQEFTRSLSDAGCLPEDPRDDDFDDDETVLVREYSVETWKAIERLNVMGFSMSRIQREYEECRAADLGVFESWAEEESEDGTHWFADDWGILQGLDFSAYSDALSEVISRGLRPVPFDDLKRPGLDPKVRYLLDDDDGYPFRFGNTDIRCLLRLACELVPADSRVVLDVSDLIDSGYCDEQELICADAVQALTARHPENAPRIVLTEGSTDARILQEALALTKPHLAEYYTFMDFGSSRLPGGAGHLVSLVKAFSAAGITNRVIALFDNDTAAHEAVRALESARLLPSIAIVFLPDLELLRAYPTLGPGGLTSMDVNGLAASIELYLGEDLLRGVDGRLTPVQWKGFSESLNQYQGEVMHKARLHTAYFERLALCKANSKAVGSTDWSGLSAILDLVFGAFD